MANPNEKPILFSGPMIQAILAGRKVQTRRVVKPQPPSVEAVRAKCGEGFKIGAYHGPVNVFSVNGPVWAVRELMGEDAKNGPSWKCPYGRAGTLLWVRETWAETGELPTAVYKADFVERYGAWERDTPGGVERVETWRPSIHMPRWASRILLRVTDVRVERVQDITEEDARAESCQSRYQTEWDGETEYGVHITAREQFRSLWDSINGKRPGCSWADSPWVWVVSFERVREAGEVVSHGI